jgi:hypothetical protein
MFDAGGRDPTEAEEQFERTLKGVAVSSMDFGMEIREVGIEYLRFAGP